MTTAYIIAKRYFHGDLIAYLRHDEVSNRQMFDTTEPMEALFYPDELHAELAAGDWQSYWASKGYPGLRATLETVTEANA